MHRTLSGIQLPAVAELSVTHCRSYMEKDVLGESLPIFGHFSLDIGMKANRLHKVWLLLAPRFFFGAR